MLTVLARAARLLGAHWPALLAWILGGTLVHFLALKLAAFVGAGSAVGGILLLLALIRRGAVAGRPLCWPPTPRGR